jgi:hypothetical protein
MNEYKYGGIYRIPSARRRNWDYGANAAYFVTICTPLFGQGSALSALSAQALPASASLLAGAACQDKPDEAQPRPNTGVAINHKNQINHAKVTVQTNCASQTS